jgi:hypothetical protein
MSLQLEARDIIEMISRYIASNKNKVCFIGSFFAIDDSKNCIKEGSDLTTAFGDKEMLRMMLNHLRDMIEEAADEEGFVNI